MCVCVFSYFASCYRIPSALCFRMFRLCSSVCILLFFLWDSSCVLISDILVMCWPMDVLFSCSFLFFPCPALMWQSVLFARIAVWDPMCKHRPVQGGIADKKKGDYKSSVHLMIAAIGRNMYMQTHNVFISELCRLNKNKHCLTI